MHGIAEWRGMHHRNESIAFFERRSGCRVTAFPTAVPKKITA